MAIDRGQTVTQAVDQRRQAQAAHPLAEDPGGAAMAVREDQTYWTGRQIAALAGMGVKDATVGELQMFLHVCNTTGLDPFMRQIYMIPRREKVDGHWQTKQTIQVGIDGFRIIRERGAAKARVGVEFEDTIWYDAKGHEHKVWLQDGNPVACKVVLVKVTPDGMKLRYPAVLRMASYLQSTDYGPTAQWKTQADHMLEKCCEAFASRRAFPNDLGGLYIAEEMGSDPGSMVVSKAGAKVVAGRVAPEGDQPVDAEVVPDEPDPTPEELRVAALRWVKEQFEDYGLGGKSKADHQARTALVAILGSPDQMVPLTITTMAELNVDQAQQAARRLLDVITDANDHGRDVHEELVSLANAVTQSTQDEGQPQ